MGPWLGGKDRCGDRLKQLFQPDLFAPTTKDYHIISIFKTYLADEYEYPMPFLIKIVTWQIPSLSSIQGKDRTIEKERMAVDPF